MLHVHRAHSLHTNNKMKTLIIATIPIVFAIVCYMLCILLQYIDYRKKRLPKEKYSEFCKRVYTRYL